MISLTTGCSNLLAKQIIDSIGGVNDVDKVKFSFFTAGSGSAGPTILSATFLILGEDVLTYVKGRPVFKKSATDSNSINFGPKIGNREVARLNLIECEACFQYGVANVETFFGTAPPVWNRLFQIMALTIPKTILQNKDLMDRFARFSLPMVRLVDIFVGGANGKQIAAFSYSLLRLFLHTRPIHTPHNVHIQYYLQPFFQAMCGPSCERG